MFRDTFVAIRYSQFLIDARAQVQDVAAVNQQLAIAVDLVIERAGAV